MAVAFFLKRILALWGLLSLLTIAATAPSAAASVFSGLSLTDQLRYQANATVVRQGNLDDVINGNTTLSVCHLATLLPLTSIHTDTKERIPYTTLGSLQGVAALLLALSHLNGRDGSIVPEISSLADRCPQLRFTTELLDSQLDERVAIDQVIGSLQRHPLPCAFVGSYRSAVTMPTSIITGLQGYPQFSALSTSSALDDADQFPLAGRLNPSDDGTALASILYLQNLKVDHLAVVHTNDAYGNAYVNGLIQAAATHAPSMRIQSVDLPFSLHKAAPGLLERRVQKLKATGFRYFFAIIFDAVHYDPLMTEAVRQGIAGTGAHQWIFSDGVGVGRMVQRNYTQALFQASRGTGMITAVGGLPSDGQGPYDKLSTALKELPQEDLQYLNSKLPHYADHPDYNAQSVLNDPQFLQEPGLLAPFLYDTVVALGLAACRVVAQGRPLMGPDHFQYTVQSDFQGASGRIAMDPQTGTRNATSALFSITNFVQAGDGNRIRAVVSSVFRNGVWESLEPYVFNDGTTVPPSDLPPQEMDANHIAPAARVLIWLLGSLSLGLSLGFAVWTKTHSTDRVVQASQPIFLYIVCLGTFLMGLSVLLLGVDDGIVKEQACQVACIAFPWLLSLGFALTASALSSKTHRINLIVNQRHFRRIAVSALDVMKPMFCLVGINAVVLIVWNVLDTADWVRETTAYDVFGRPSESTGSCTYEGALPYLIILAVTNVGALLYTCYEAYVARDISTSYAESEYIFKSMATVLLVCFIGIPVAILTEKDSTAFNCAIAGIVCACSFSFQLFIFVPKIKFNGKAVREDQVGPSGLVRRKRDVFRSGVSRSSSFNSTTDRVSESSGSEEVGMRVFNRKHIQSDLQEENRTLSKENKKLQKQLRLLQEKCNAKEGDDSGSMDPMALHPQSVVLEEMSALSSTPFYVSEQERIIEMDPIEHDDESHMSATPF